MARQRMTITVDRAKAESARALVGAASTSEVVDLALDRLIRTERRRHDVAAYRRLPATDVEAELALLDAVHLDDPTDWEMVYADEER
jgi:hypothetical protein